MVYLLQMAKKWDYLGNAEIFKLKMVYIYGNIKINLDI